MSSLREAALQDAEIFISQFRVDSDDRIRSEAVRVSNTIRAALAAQEDAGLFLIYFDDADRKPEVFTSRSAAVNRYKQISVGWGAHFFERTHDNCDPAQVKTYPTTQEGQDKRDDTAKAVAWDIAAAIRALAQPQSTK